MLVTHMRTHTYRDVEAQPPRVSGGRAINRVCMTGVWLCQQDPRVEVGDWASA